MIIQLNPHLPLDTPKGPGYAWFLIDYGIEEDLLYVVAIDDSSELWTFRNKDVRAQKNITLGRIKENSMVSKKEDMNMKKMAKKMEHHEEKEIKERERTKERKKKMKKKKEMK